MLQDRTTLSRTIKVVNLQQNRQKMGQLLNITDIKILYPNEWVLLGNPVMDESKIDVLSGIPLFHSKDKKEVCYIGRDKTSNFDKITLIYTGTFRPTRKITGIFNRVTK
jgi:hypothetical protein